MASEVVLLRLEGTVERIAFVYYGYFYSSKGGTIQFIAYTGQNLFEEYRRDLEDLLNRFVAN